MSIVVDRSGNSPAPGFDRHIRGHYDLQALRDIGTAVHLTSGVGSVRAGPFAEHIEAITITPLQDIYFKMGDVTVTASSADKVIKAGVTYTQKLGPDVLQRYVAVLQVSAGGDVSVQPQR